MVNKDAVNSNKGGLLMDGHIYLVKLSECLLFFCVSRL